MSAYNARYGPGRLTANTFPDQGQSSLVTAGQAEQDDHCHASEPGKCAVGELRFGDGEAGVLECQSRCVTTAGPDIARDPSF